MPYLVVVYDVAVRRQRSVRTFLAQRLSHAQRSVFEGELTDAQIRILREGLIQRLGDGDSALLYEWSDLRQRRRTALGTASDGPSRIVG